MIPDVKPMSIRTFLYGEKPENDELYVRAAIRPRSEPIDDYDLETFLLWCDYMSEIIWWQRLSRKGHDLRTG